MINSDVQYGLGQNRNGTKLSYCDVLSCDDFTDASQEEAVNNMISNAHVGDSINHDLKEAGTKNISSIAAIPRVDTSIYVACCPR